MAKLKAVLLIPSGFAGAFTVLAFSIPPRTAADVAIPVAILTPLYAGHLALIAWMGRQPYGRRFFGHSGRTWSILIAVAYLVGVVASLLA